MSELIERYFAKDSKKKLTNWLLRLGLCLALACQALAQGEPAAAIPPKAAQATPQTNPELKLNLQLAPVGRQMAVLSSFAPVAKKVEPSVVTVYSRKTVHPSKNPLSNDPLFRRFFGPGSPGTPDLEEEDPGDEEEEGGAPPHPMPKDRQESSLGSGVIVSSDGYIVSNSHVVDDADEVKVSLADGRTEYTAKVIGVDKATDISLIKVEATNLPAIAITDSSTLKVGDTVLAVGNPFGVGHTVTLGIVSAMGRGGFGIVDYEDFIQTDASINPGNSGGALVDVEGRLVGIPTAILSRSGGNVGIGFAVPINMTRKVLDALVKDGKVLRGYLGVFVQSLSPGLKKAFKTPDQNGALISGIAPNSPAAKAGLKEGDVITALNGKSVADSRELRLLISQTSPSSKADMTILRDGKQKNFSAMLGELPTEQKVAAKEPEKIAPPTGRKVDGTLGLQVRDLSPEIRAGLKLPANLNGVLIEAVERNSPAFAAGLRPGDVLQEVNRRPIRNGQEAVNLSKDPNNGGLMLLRVWSKGGSRFVVVDVGAKEK